MVEIRYRSVIHGLFYPLFLGTMIIYTSVIMENIWSYLAGSIITLGIISYEIYLIMIKSPMFVMSQENITMKIPKHVIKYHKIYHSYLFEIGRSVNLILCYVYNDKFYKLQLRDVYSIPLEEINDSIRKQRNQSEKSYDFSEIKSYAKIKEKCDKQKFHSFNWFMPMLSLVLIAILLWRTNQSLFLSINLYIVIGFFGLEIIVSLIAYKYRFEKRLFEIVQMMMFFGLMTYYIYFI